MGIFSSVRLDKNRLRNWGISTLMLLIGLKILDFGIGYFTNDKLDLKITDQTTLQQHIEEQVAKDGLDFASLKSEINQLYYQYSSYHPYRWYSLPPNFKGKYVQTDSLGFRNNDMDTNKYKIGIFGGSTTFGIYNEQASTIPALLSSNLADSIQIINYAIGAYSSTTELMTLLEVLRRNRLDEAIFYDGVNEICMYLEGLYAADFDNPSYQVMGHYFAATKTAIRNTFGMDENFSKHDGFFYKSFYSFYPHLVQRFKIKKPELGKITAENVAAHAKIIINIYSQNKTQIQQFCTANSIKAHFLWQPHLMSTAKPLTPNEKGIQSLEQHKELRMLAAAVQKEMKSLNVINFTTALDQQKENLFMDWCHLNKTGNQIIAQKIKTEILR